MKSIPNTFVNGLLFSLPLIVTFGLLYWFLATAEGLLKIPLQWLLPEGWYITGMGVVSALVLVFCIGLLAQAFFIKYLFSWLEGLLEKIPLVKTLYSSAKDLIQFFTAGKDKELSSVVSVCFDGNIQLIGFITNEQASLPSPAQQDSAKEDPQQEEMYSVYFPMSYQVGGYLAYIPKSRCTLLDIPVQKAMQQVLTANIKRSTK